MSQEWHGLKMSSFGSGLGAAFPERNNTCKHNKHEIHTAARTLTGFLRPIPSEKIAHRPRATETKKSASSVHKAMTPSSWHGLHIERRNATKAKRRREREGRGYLRIRGEEISYPQQDTRHRRKWRNHGILIDVKDRQKHKVVCLHGSIFAVYLALALDTQSLHSVIYLQDDKSGGGTTTTLSIEGLQNINLHYKSQVGSRVRRFGPTERLDLLVFIPCESSSIFNINSPNTIQCHLLQPAYLSLQAYRHIHYRLEPSPCASFLCGADGAGRGVWATEASGLLIATGSGKDSSQWSSIGHGESTAMSFACLTAKNCLSWKAMREMNGPDGKSKPSASR
ncbi:hypothetical protein M436DRAFT_62578 [Aureobasidium namibiae CBS 147.97]|uniref:Uncharacterized protein n=1 Tax=Aureobasidium namibiae CBS 147.97 TaxID=1043004 RepID=A0A074WUI2_9PEZI